MADDLETRVTRLEVSLDNHKSQTEKDLARIEEKHKSLVNRLGWLAGLFVAGIVNQLTGWLKIGGGQ